jgi:fatty acid desaturase
MSRLFKRTGGLWPTLAVLAYTLIGWPTGIYLLTRSEIGLDLLGVCLVAHTLVISAYLIHDCAHHAIFTGGRANDRLGQIMGWLNGACLADYFALKKKHLRHHADRLDVVTFDYRATLLGMPAALRRLVLLLEWAYVPAVELVMRGLVIRTPFTDGTRRERARILLFIAVRAAGFLALAWVSVKAVLLYALAYLIFVDVLRFMDAFQHTYEVFVSRTLDAAPADPRRDLRYEYENTFSNLIAERAGWLNLLVLNFSYHNAQPVRPGEPWYRLPALHRSLYGANRDAQVIPCAELLASFHRYRVQRVFAADYGTVAPSGARAERFMGAIGVSFLTAV